MNDLKGSNIGYVKEGIPRRIIQTDRSRDLPLAAKAATTNLRLLNPDFEYLFFDDAQVEEFIDAEFPQYRPLVDSFPARIATIYSGISRSIVSAASILTPM